MRPVDRMLAWFGDSAVRPPRIPTDALRPEWIDEPPTTVHRLSMSDLVRMGVTSHTTVVLGKV